MKNKPKSPKKDIEDVEEIETRTIPEEFLQSAAVYGSNELYLSFLENEKKWVGFVKIVERLVRKNNELRALVRYLKDELDLSACLYFPNVDISSEVAIELHHAPFTLFDIVDIVGKKQLYEAESSFTTFSVAAEVVRLHYEKKVGLVPLSKTIHELVHAEKLHLPFPAIFGDVASFVREYKEFISPSSIHKIKSMLTFSEEDLLRSSELLKVSFKFNEMTDFLEENSKLLDTIDKLIKQPSLSET